MKVSPARAAAFDALLRVERDGAFATDALDALLEGLEKRADAALATELTMGVLRSRRTLDFLIQHFVGRPAESLDLEVLLALRISLYQLRFLSRVPASAAVNESVELAKRARKRSAAGLVNAALRRAARDERTKGSLDALLPAGLSPADGLGMLLSHPTWLVECWFTRFGELNTRALLAVNNQPPRLCGAVVDAARAGDVLTSLAEDGFDVQPGAWLASAVELKAVPRGGVAASRAVRAGRLLIQDEASQMIPLLLDVKQGQRVLDLCAAPGGKVARLAQQASVVAGDLHPHRLRQMRELLRKIAARDVRLVALDAGKPLPFNLRFDRILLDAPCSGTGTLARNPEIRWRLQPQDLAALQEKQKAMLRQALSQLAPGGRLVYSTCSLEPEENEEVLAAALAEFPGARVVNAEPALAPHLRTGVKSDALFDAQGCFRTFPPRHGTDGFFAAALELAS